MHPAGGLQSPASMSSWAGDPGGNRSGSRRRAAATDDALRGARRSMEVGVSVADNGVENAETMRPLPLLPAPGTAPASARQSSNEHAQNPLPHPEVAHARRA